MAYSKITLALVAFGCALMPVFQGSDAAAQNEAETPDHDARMDVLNRHLKAYKDRDLDRFVATFAPDAEVYSNGMIARGRKEIRAFYKLNFVPGAPRIVVESRDANEQYVFLSVRYLFSDGQEHCCSLSEYEIKDGTITYLAAN